MPKADRLWCTHPSTQHSTHSHSPAGVALLLKCKLNLVPARWGLNYYDVICATVLLVAINNIIFIICITYTLLGMMCKLWQFKWHEKWKNTSIEITYMTWGLNLICHKIQIYIIMSFLWTNSTRGKDFPYLIWILNIKAYKMLFEYLLPLTPTHQETALFTIFISFPLNWKKIYGKNIILLRSEEICECYIIQKPFTLVLVRTFGMKIWHSS